MAGPLSTAAPVVVAAAASAATTTRVAAGRARKIVMKGPSAIELSGGGTAARPGRTRRDNVPWMRRGGAPQRPVARTTEMPGSGVDLSAADGPVARTPAAPTLNLLTITDRIKRRRRSPPRRSCSFSCRHG